MFAKPVVPQIELAREITPQQRIELIIDLTRRLGLLNDLLRTARMRREATDLEAVLTQMNRAEFEDIVIGPTWRVAPFWLM
jgi:hypothetical protein